MTEETTNTTASVPAHSMAASVDHRAIVKAGNMGVSFASMDDMYRFAKAVVLSGLAPKGMTKPETVLIAMQSGMELGYRAMQALQNVVVVNGKPSVYGDGALALVRASGHLEDMQEAWSGELENGTRKCTLTMKRKGQTAIVRSFCISDARRAGLWGKAGPWTQYPERMLWYRALAFALRDLFSDVLKGVGVVEEVRDYRVGARDITAETRVQDVRALQLMDEAPAEPPTPPATPPPVEPVVQPELLPKHDRAALIKEIWSLVDKKRKVSFLTLQKRAGIKVDEGEDWEMATTEQLVVLASFMRC